MAYSFTEARIGLQPIATNSTVKNHALGTIVRAMDPTYGEAEFIYLAGVTGTVAGSWVVYDDLDGATKLLAASHVGPVAIAMSANVGSEYGWYMISGKHSAAQAWASLSLATGAILYGNASAGTVDDAVVSGDRIYRATVDVAKVTAVATVAVTINRPEVTSEDPTT
jgi:hypothetical protein